MRNDANKNREQAANATTNTEHCSPQGKSIGRRQFVAGAVTTAATLAIVKPSAVRGSEANSKIEVGCIGVGGRGRQIAGRIEAHGGYKISSVADYFPQVAEDAAKKHSVSADRTFSGLLGYQRLIASGVDAVILETPPYCFPDHATAAVNAGCHVYMAKPVANDVPGCLTIKSMGEKATRNKQVFLVDFQMRVDPHLTECIRRLRAGALGSVKFLRCFYDDEGFHEPPLTDTWASRFRRLVWVNDVALGGGKLVNAGIHAVDAALWIVGSLPVSCTGSAIVNRPNPHGDTNDCYALTYRFEDGTIMSYSGQQYPTRKGFNCGCDVFGQGGYMETRYAGKTWMAGGQNPYDGGTMKGLYVDGIDANLKTFHQQITQGVYDNVTVEPSVNSNLAVILGREAGKNHTTLTWDELIRSRERIEVDFTGLVQ